MDNVLEVRNLSQRFGGIVAVDNVSILVKRGSIHGVIGPNGSGKTTLFNCVTGVYKVQTGTVTLDGTRIDLLPTYKISSNGLARTFQGGRLFKDLTIEQNMFSAQALRFRSGFWDAFFHTPKYKAEFKKAQERQLELLKIVDVEPDEINKVRSMPVKQQRLIEIARALSCDPSVILLDEPAAGMDPVETRDLAKVIYAIRDAGITVVMIEHDMKLAMEVCDYVSVLCYGKLIAEGTPIEIQNNPEVITAYLGKTGKVEVKEKNAKKVGDQPQEP